jgi:hypothetical protein
MKAHFLRGITMAARTNVQQAKMLLGSGEHDEGGSCSGKSMGDNRTTCRVRKFPAASASAAHARRGPAAVSFHPLSQRAAMPAPVRAKDASQKHKAASANAGTTGGTTLLGDKAAGGVPVTRGIVAGEGGGLLNPNCPSSANSPPNH